MREYCKFLTAVVIVQAAAQLAGCTSSRTLTSALPSKAVEITDSSYFDHKERFELLRTTRDPTLLSATRPVQQCSRKEPPEPPEFLKIPQFYGDPAGYAKATVSLQQFENLVTEIAEYYVVTGDGIYARCLTTLLSKWAERNSLFDFHYGKDGRQSWYNAVWTTVSAGFAYSIVRSDASLTIETRGQIESWLNRLARKHLGLPGGQGDCCNNHAFWRGLEAAIVGITTSDRDLLMLGTRAYRAALKSMNEDGSFPLEMARGERAIHYQNFAILPLVYIAEIGHRQKLDLYGLAVEGKTLHRAIAFLLSAIENPAIVKKYTDLAQDVSFMKTRSVLNWMEPYHARFPSEQIASILTTRRPIVHRYGGGNSTLFFYRPARD